jgi:glyoxylase-like metal-dependent hydrolase (beta-lactamase superfamily II)/8-oxo-dGTP pyrophosphatase MutT (NUDIX family)
MLRPAVSLAVSRRSRLSEILLVERSPNLRFFGGFHAFPGGAVDEEDGSVPVEGAAESGLASLLAAGARELFEETGIWIARGARPPEPSELREDRRRLIAGEIGFRAVLDRHRQHVDARDLEPLCRMTTPPFQPVRFETQFLRVLVPDESPLDIWDGELVSGEFVAPESALDRWRRGEVAIAPPMIVLLGEWGREGAFERIRAIASGYENGKLHRIYFSPGIILVPLKTKTQPPATHTNTVVLGEERLYVVDPAPTDVLEQERLFDLLEDLVAEGRKLEGILLTHYHSDHVGALLPMQKRFPLPAHAHQDQMDRLPSARFGKTLSDGDELDLGRAPDGSPDWRLRVYHVPGHARGHLAFQESRYGAIAVGDLVSTLSTILVDPSDGHLATYLESLRFLETVTRGALYPGHGPPAREGRAVIQKTLEHRREREQQILDALSSEPQSVEELLRRVYTDVDPGVYHLAERSLLSGLIKLEEEGRVRKVAGGYSLAL